MVCIICDKRPAKERGYCANCEAKIAKEERRSRCQTDKPEKFLTYQGIVVGLYPAKDGKTFRGELLLKRDADKLPKYQTLNLDTYLDGFTREQIKRLKAGILHLAHSN